MFKGEACWKWYDKLKEIGANGDWIKFFLQM
jgi:hypothetical protein